MLISSWEQLVQQFPELKDREDGPTLALRKYLELGGIVKVERKGNSIKLLYPNKEILKERIKRLKEEKKRYEEYLHRFKRVERDVLPVKLAFDPLFYEHMMRMLADRKYREDFEKLGFDWRAFLTPRTRKIIEQFIHNPEYRRRVLEALEQSPVYRKRKFGALIEEAKKVSRQVAKRREEIIREKIKKLEQELFILNQLLRWT